jgi:hypothetical protein
MARFAVYALGGLVELWFLLFMWGFSRGPANALPYLALIGCLTLVLLAAPLALLFDRLASVLALFGGVLACAWAVAAVQEGSLPGALIVGALPALTCALAVRHLVLSRADRWLSHPPEPRLRVRVGLAVLPFALFILAFNEGFVFAVVLAGPPR